MPQLLLLPRATTPDPACGCSQQNGATASILCKGSQEGLRTCQAAADPRLLGGNPACQAPAIAAPLGHDAGSYRHAAASRTKRRPHFFVRAARRACALIRLQQTLACSVAIRRAGPPLLLLPRPRRRILPLRCRQQNEATASLLCEGSQEDLRTCQPAADPRLLGGNPACQASAPAAPQATTPDPTVTLPPAERSDGLASLRGQPGGPAHLSTCSRPSLARWQSGVPSLRSCCSPGHDAGSYRYAAASITKRRPRFFARAARRAAR